MDLELKLFGMNIRFDVIHISYLHVSPMSEVSLLQHECITTWFTDSHSLFLQVDFSIHDNLAVFTAIMIARHCFTLENLVRNVALQSLLAACPSGNYAI
jgi:hypothetical protein